MKKFAIVMILLTSWSLSAPAQTVADPSLLAEIFKIKAIDNHAHPVLAPPLDASDREFDALPGLILGAAVRSRRFAAGFSPARRCVESTLRPGCFATARCTRAQTAERGAEKGRGTAG